MPPTPPPTPREKCAGCAFRPGTEAQQSDLTRLKARLCVLALDPFLCHENAVDGQLPAGEERLCVGYAEAMGVLHRRGYYDALPDWKQDVLNGLLAHVVSVEDRLLAGETVDDDTAVEELHALLGQVQP